MATDMKELVTQYVMAVGERRFDRLEEMVHPEATFSGTVKTETEGAEAYVQGFRNLGPVIERNEIRDLLIDGNRAFVLYDFVTNTAVGPVLCGELVTVHDGLIRSSTLIFDWRRWPEVLRTLQAP